MTPARSINGLVKIVLLAVACIVVGVGIKEAVVKFRSHPKPIAASAEPWKNDPIVADPCRATKDEPWKCDPIVK